MSSVELSEIVRNWAIVLAGAIGLWLAVWRGYSHDRQAKAQERQAHIAQRSHVTEVFTNAVSLLRDEKLEIRFGAISSLIQIATDYSEFSNTVINLLQAYVRERSKDVDEIDLEVDILTVMNFLHERLRGASVDVENENSSD